MLARELGSGAFSVVKLGVHLESGRKTAVKIVSKKKLSEEDYAALLMEIQILTELDHPHIIKSVYVVLVNCSSYANRCGAVTVIV